MIDLKPQEMELVKAILRQALPQCEIFAFGSRVTGSSSRFSDLDLAIRGPTAISLSQIAEVREAFEQSDLPMKVDVLDFSRADPEFQNVILKQHAIIQEPPNSSGGPQPH